MSAESVVQAAVLAAVRGVAGLNGVYLGPPVKATVPFAELGDLLSGDWSVKDRAGRELRLIVTVRDAGDSPARAQALDFIERSEKKFDTHAGERGRMLLGNAGVHIMRSGTFTEITGDAIRTRGGGGDDHQSRLVFETGLQRSHGHLTVVFARVKRLAERAVRILPMIRLALAGMRLRIGLVASVGTILRLGLIAETQALGGVDMQHDGMVDILQVFKRRDQRVHIVALLHQQRCRH